MFGRMPQLSGNDKEDITALYDYIIALRREFDDMLFNLDSENIREINAEIVNVYNLNAANIKANTIMSNVNMIIGSGNNLIFTHNYRSYRDFLFFKCPPGFIQGCPHEIFV